MSLEGRYFEFTEESLGHPAPFSRTSYILVNELLDAAL